MTFEEQIQKLCSHNQICSEYENEIAYINQQCGFKKMLVNKEKLVNDFHGRIKIYDLCEGSSMLEPTTPQGGLQLSHLSCLILVKGKSSWSFCFHV